MKIIHICLFLVIVLFSSSCRNTLSNSKPELNYVLSNRFDEWSLATIENLEAMKNDNLHSFQNKRLINYQNMVKGSLMRKNLLNFIDSVKLTYPNYDSLILDEGYWEGEVSSYDYGLIVCRSDEYIYYNLYQYAFDKNPKVTSEKIISQEQFFEFYQIFSKLCSYNAMSFQRLYGFTFFLY